MNRFFVLFCSFMLTGALVSAQKTTTIKGKITNPAGETVSVRYVSNPLTGKDESVKATLNENGEFEMSLELVSPVAASFAHGDETSGMYLHPGDDLIISLNPEEFDETISYEGKGAAYNNFKAAYFLKFSDDSFYTEQREKMKELDGTAFKVYAQEMFESKKAFLDKWKEEHSLSDEFITHMHTDFLYTQAIEFFQYPSYHKYLNKPQEGETADIKPLPSDYYAFLEEIPVQNEAALASSSYQQYISQFINHKYGELYKGISNPDHSSWIKTQMYLSKILLEGKVEEYMTASMLKSALRYGDPTSIVEEYKAFIEAHPAHIPVLEPQFKKVLALAPGNKAPDFTLVNLEGNKVALSDFQGKVVYMDFWASWCGPCIAEIPSAKKLKEHYKGNKDVVFLYVSVDTDEKAWRNIIEKKELTGVHLYADGWEVASEKYNVGGIPSYFLINKDGTIAAYQAPRPSSGEKLTSLIDEALSREVAMGSSEEE